MEPDILVQKALDAANEWQLANWIGNYTSQHVQITTPHWRPPFKDEVKCNIGFSWSKKLSLSGASWIIKDNGENVILYSRRAYSQIASVFEAKLKSWEWDIESMKSFHMENVTFGASTKEIINALQQPRLWPSIRV